MAYHNISISAFLLAKLLRSWDLDKSSRKRQTSRSVMRRPTFRPAPTSKHHPLISLFVRSHSCMGSGGCIAYVAEPSSPGTNYIAQRLLGTLTCPHYPPTPSPENPYLHNRRCYQLLKLSSPALWHPGASCSFCGCLTSRQKTRSVPQA